MLTEEMLWNWKNKMFKHNSHVLDEFEDNIKRDMYFLRIQEIFFMNSKFFGRCQTCLDARKELFQKIL